MVWGRFLLSCSLGHSLYLPRSHCDSQAQRVARWLRPSPPCAMWTVSHLINGVPGGGREAWARLIQGEELEA